MERARDPNLRPNPDDQRDADVKQPTRSKAETVWIHTEINLIYQRQLSLYWLEQIRRKTASRVHFLGRDLALRCPSVPSTCSACDWTPVRAANLLNQAIATAGLRENADSNQQFSFVEPQRFGSSKLPLLRRLPRLR